MTIFPFTPTTIWANITRTLTSIFGTALTSGRTANATLAAGLTADLRPGSALLAYDLTLVVVTIAAGSAEIGLWNGITYVPGLILGASANNLTNLKSINDVGGYIKNTAGAASLTYALCYFIWQ